MLKILACLVLLMVVCAGGFVSFRYCSCTPSHYFPFLCLVSNPSKKIIVIGGGAAGFFFAVNCAERHPHYHITILEKSGKLLEKVRISGGGRCNVTHACYEPAALTERYPRGKRELLGAFHRFQPRDTVQWFADRDVELKTEDDGRMFPITDSSETIAQCLLTRAAQLGIIVRTHCEADTMKYTDAQWHITSAQDEALEADIVYIATGSALRMWTMLERMGYEIVPPVPSLFTFNIKDERIKGLQGIAVENATIRIASAKLSETGPVLITHWGLSGPAILRLSAWGAVALQEQQYKFELLLNWTSTLNTPQTIAHLKQYKQDNPKRNVLKYPLFKLPSRLWERLCMSTGIQAQTWADMTNKEIDLLANTLSHTTLPVSGKSTFKEEFVTCGGVALHQVDFKTFGSKLHPNLYFGGEVLNIDAITGGFNFQAAWTGAWLAATSI